MSRSLGIAEKPAADITEESEKSGVRATTALGSTRLRFERSAHFFVLTVEAPSRDDLIPDLYRLLLAAGAQVVRVHAQVLGDRTLHELAIVDREGNLLDEDRWRDVQASIFEHLGDRVAPIGPELSFTRATVRTQREVAE
jgi:hypothetical protein